MHCGRPRRTERLYIDGRFNTDPERRESFGDDLGTGAEHTETEYRAKYPRGRAFLHASEYEPGPETPDDEHPFVV